MVARGPRTRVIEIHEQLARFRLRWPEWQCTLTSNRRSKSTRKLVAEGPLQPYAGGTTYTTRVEYDGRLAPKVWIKTPELQPRDGEPIPHMYNQERVCCFLPQTDWWRDIVIADYVPGRVAQWLYFYEIWRASGTWYGGGVHPQVNPKVRRLATRIDSEAPLE